MAKKKSWTLKAAAHRLEHFQGASLKGRNTVSGAAGRK